MKILLVEDEPAILRVVKRGLQQARYMVETAEDGNRGLELAQNNLYTLVILDVMLPGLNGWQICTELRRTRVKTPILMLTARAALDERVRGLELGADDYLTKPFEFPELLARIQALLRRDKMHRTRLIQIADLEIDTTAYRVKRAGQEIALSQREYQLLEALASYEGQVLTRDVIQERIWMDEDNYSNTVDVYIGLLRKKIDADHPQKLIQTVRGMGYTLRVPAENMNQADRGEP